MLDPLALSQSGYGLANWYEPEMLRAGTVWYTKRSESKQGHPVHSFRGWFPHHKDPPTPVLLPHLHFLFFVLLFPHLHGLEACHT